MPAGGLTEIDYTRKFTKLYRQLPADIQRQFHVCEARFRQNPFDPLLRTHRLKGNLKIFWAFSVTSEYRVVFTFDGSRQVTFYRIGTHDQAYR